MQALTFRYESYKRFVNSPFEVQFRKTFGIHEAISQVVGRAVGAWFAVIFALLATCVSGQTLTLVWNPNSEPDITGYRLSYGTRSGEYSNTVATSGTSANVGGLEVGRTYYFVVKAVNQAGLQSAPSNEISHQVAATLPLPWSEKPIGPVNPAADAFAASGLFTIQGSGTLTSTADTGNFVWQSLRGSGEIIVRVHAFEGAGKDSRAGVMIRDSLAPNSKHIFIGVDGEGGHHWIYRRTTGGESAHRAGPPGAMPNVWLRLKRVGKSIIVSKSHNGSKWQRVGTIKRKTLSLGASCYIGFSVTSGTDELCTATFSLVRVRP